MKRTCQSLAVLAAVGIAAAAGADVITSWNFENFTVLPANGTSSGNVASSGGAITGNASGQHASASTVWSAPAGNISVRSFSSNNWAAGDYYQFASSSTGYQSITIQWDQTGSATGPRDFGLFWSTDGTIFTPIGSTYAVLVNGAPNPSWGSGTGGSVYTFGPIAGPAGMDNQATIYFRLVNANTTAINGGTVGTGGTDRVDNVIISGTLIPTPGAAALMGMGLLASSRRRRA